MFGKDATEQWMNTALTMAKTTWDMNRRNLELMREQTERMVDLSKNSFDQLQGAAQNGLEEWVANAGKMYALCVDAVQNPVGYWTGNSGQKSKSSAVQAKTEK